MEQTLLADVLAFMAQHDMSPSRFGRLAVNDHKVVSQMQAGRRMWPETESRIRDFMRTYVASAQAA